MATAHVNGIDISYALSGEGEPLVLIQGMGGTKEAWFLQTRAFRKHYQVLAFDNRGAGQTRDDGQPFSTRDMADDTVALMDFLGIRQAHILGYSLGGVVAQEIAIQYPERLKKLILASTMPGGMAPRETTSETLLRAVQLDEVTKAEDLEDADIPGVAAAIIEHSFNKPLIRAVVKYLSLSRMRGQDGTTFARQMRAPATASTLERLGSISAPTLVITGTDDEIISPLASEVLSSRIPHAKLVKIKGGSHAMSLEMAGRFNREVLAFLAG